MSRTPAQRSLLFVMLIVAGLITFILNANNGVTKEETHSQVRMAVDPNILPILQPDGTEAPATKTPESDSADLEVSKPETPVEPKTPAPIPDQPAPAPAPEQKPAPTPATPAKTAATGIVKSISLSETDTGFTVTVLADRPIGDTSYMNFSTPRRLVIDLREPWTWKGKNVVRAENGPVKHIVLGPHPDRLRLVVYFRTHPTGMLHPLFKREGNTLTVSVPLP